MPTTAAEISERWLDSEFKFFVNREGSIKDRIEFLIERDRMKDEYLGACLDYVRWGSITTVMYEWGTTGLIKFIQHWMKLNPDLPWTDEQPSETFTLPRIHYKRCSRNEEHKGTIVDAEGKIRCAYVDTRLIKPSFVEHSGRYFDDLSQMDSIAYWDNKPPENLPDDAWDEKTGKLLSGYKKQWQEYQEQLARYEAEEPVELKDSCYALISEGQRVLSLERVLDRLNLEPKMKRVYCHGIFSPCDRVDEMDEWERESYEMFERCPGHEQENDRTIHPFDGWTLAWYIQRWHEQSSNGSAPVFNKQGEKDTYKKFRDFISVAS